MKKTRQKIYQYTAVFEKNEDDGYTVTVPSLPGLVTEGDTLKEAREMAEDAIRCYLQSIQKDGLAIPRDKGLRQNPVKEKVRVVLTPA